LFISSFEDIAVAFTKLTCAI